MDSRFPCPNPGKVKIAYVPKSGSPAEVVWDSNVDLERHHPLVKRKKDAIKIN